MASVFIRAGDAAVAGTAAGVIDGDALADGAAQQTIDGLTAGLAEDVPEGEIEGGEGAHFRAGLTEALAGHAHVGEVRGDGLMAAVEFVEDKDDRRFFDPARKVGPAISAALLEEGVIGRAMPQGDILGFAPQLCLTRDEPDTVVKASERAVRTILG